MGLVIGYGSLLDPARARALCEGRGGRLLGTRVGLLRGFRRHWGLAYRNGCWEDGRFVHRETGGPYEGGVAFLGIREAERTVMPVREIEVDAAGLAGIDDEEFLYRRVDVRARYTRLDGSPPEEPAWLYVDAPEGFPGGRYEGDRIVVTREYWNLVTDAAAALLPDGVSRFETTTDSCLWPLVDLVWKSTYSAKK